MSTQTKMTRTVKKIEAPRPLKSATNISNRNSAVDVKINSVEELILLTEAVACQISQKNFDRMLQANVETMYQFLKLHGAQLESSYKEVLDRFFIVFRDGSQNEKLDKMSRVHLLELIELRAKHWHSSEFMSDYYKYKVTTAEPLLVPTMDPGMGTSSPSPTPEPAPILGPGELIKPSGKFLKPTKIPGKNYSKDEVVIRNADSGKVMGIKGRRVHMIEELSDTIISFQRVSPGAKERLVQITGPNEENVNHAKHLIGDTIRRNASPVRLESTGSELRASDASLSSDDASPRETRTPPANNRTLLHSFSTNDAAIGEYKYTVSVGTTAIKITGNNLDIVKTAKLVLDEYFESMAALEAGAGSGDFFTLARPLPSTPVTPLPQLVPLVPIAAAELNGTNGGAANDDEVFISKSSAEESPETTPVRRPRFSRGLSSDKKEGLMPSAGSRRTYSTAALLAIAESPLSRAPPTTAPPPEIARKVCLDFDGEAHLKATGETTTIVSEEVPDSPEPE